MTRAASEATVTSISDRIRRPGDEIERLQAVEHGLQRVGLGATHIAAGEHEA